MPVCLNVDSNVSLTKDKDIEETEVLMSEVFQVTLDELGNILLPASLRERLRLAPGMTLVVERGENGGLRLRVQRKPTVLVEKEGVLVARVTAFSDLSHLLRHERDRRLFTLLQRVGL